MDQQESLRRSLVNLLTGHFAHVTLKTAVDGIPFESAGVRPDGLPWSLWEQLEHVRIAQWDIVEYTLHAEHVSPKWPQGYWPASQGPPDEEVWNKCFEDLSKDLQRMVSLIENPSTDLFAAIPHGKGHTVLREVLLLADHNAYHAGQIVLLRRRLGIWREPVAGH